MLIIYTARTLDQNLQSRSFQGGNNILGSSRPKEFQMAKLSFLKRSLTVDMLHCPQTPTFAPFPSSQRTNCKIVSRGRQHPTRLHSLGLARDPKPTGWQRLLGSIRLRRFFFLTTVKSHKSYFDIFSLLGLLPLLCYLYSNRDKVLFLTPLE